MSRHASPQGLLLVAALVAALALGTPARAEERSIAYEGAVGVGAGLCSLVYGPVKAAYALSGLVVGGLAWLFTFGDSNVAGSIVSRSVGGDYVVTPAHLEGQRALHFVGS